MKKVLTLINDVQTRVPVKLWLDDIEEGALEQARNIANLPFVFHHIAIMPDSHQGYGMPIGGVMATKNVIVPNAVGVDIGCGMCAMKSSIPAYEFTTDVLKKIMGGSKENKGGIRSKIPVGMNHHSKKQDEDNLPSILSEEDIPIAYSLYQSALKQVGTLGGGNHFIELQEGSDGFIWIMIHSGSRKLGFDVAHHYNKLAISLNEKWQSSVPKNHQLAFLPMDSKEGYQYFNEMTYCVAFAKANRNLMMENVILCIKEFFPDAEFSDYVNVSHNFAALENHFGQNVFVHRKGATRAREDQLGIIPGCQGSKSFIVKGKGNPESFMSCSHGAGRKLSRTAAQNTLDLESEKKKLDDQGIIHSLRNKKDLDEASGAYKDIDTVIENQSDLIEVVVTLKPLAVIKG